jgi:hypothetical protein
MMPGGPSGVGELIVNASRATVSAVAGYPDRRPSPPYGSNFDTIFAAPGGGPGQAGRGDTYDIYHSVTNTQTGAIAAAYPHGGGGGGWGAAGGAGGSHLTGDINGSYTVGGNPGAAGGKAIKTNGHPVTWLGGSDRAYGAIG